MNRPFTLSDFDFDLPPELIAQQPAPERTASRLLHVDGARLSDLRFSELPGLLRAGDLLVFNDTRVIKARLHGRKASGGKVEALIERVIGSDAAMAQVRASHPPAIGSLLEFGSPAFSAGAKVVDRDGRFFLLAFSANVWDVLEHLGEVPLPPYIRHGADPVDEARYQTVYARTPGAVAAPTAGLHFDEPLLAALRAHGVQTAFVTLHVGAGTFLPVQTETITEHKMHHEWYSIGADTAQAIAAAKAEGRRVIAVGTTATRALESAARATGTVAAGSGETDIFITPGYTFRVIDRLITNFHLPKSTLLMLVSAFAGYDEIMSAYRHAVAERYRFFSYGDAMLLERKPA